MKYRVGYLATNFFRKKSEVKRLMARLRQSLGPGCSRLRLCSVHVCRWGQLLRGGFSHHISSDTLDQAAHCSRQLTQAVVVDDRPPAQAGEALRQRPVAAVQLVEVYHQRAAEEHHHQDGRVARHRRLLVDERIQAVGLAGKKRIQEARRREQQHHPTAAELREGRRQQARTVQLNASHLETDFRQKFYQVTRPLLAIVCAEHQIN